MNKMHMTLSKHDKSLFERIAQKTASWAGTSNVFLIALAMIIAWAVTGPIFSYSNTWQLVINTTTTIVTFLMVFLIQNTQNRDTQAMQLKLDELIRATEGAHLVLLDLEELSENEIREVRKKYILLATDARERLRAHKKDTGKPNVEL